jgi:hypothetical protein
VAAYETVEALVDALLSARTLRAIARVNADAESWLATHDSRKDQAMIASAMESVEMMRQALELNREASRTLPRTGA